MRFSSILMACAVASSSHALPTIFNVPVYVSKVIELFEDACGGNLTQAQQPTLSPPAASGTTLPSPAAGLTLQLVAIGKGTQNYTCPTPNNPTATPTAIGALANLYNASCIAADPATAGQLANLTSGFGAMQGADAATALGLLPIAATHYFSDATTPSFSIDGSGPLAGTVHLKKAAAEQPANATDVPWLQLSAVAGQSNKVQQVYRLETYSGAAPKTCGSETGAFEVPYAAEYWFYGTS